MFHVHVGFKECAIKDAYHSKFLHYSVTFWNLLLLMSHHSMKSNLVKKKNLRRTRPKLLVKKLRPKRKQRCI